MRAEATKGGGDLMTKRGRRGAPYLRRSINGGLILIVPGIRLPTEQKASDAQNYEDATNRD
jgi:orotidine-5'-phosphate decarboxylase